MTRPKGIMNNEYLRAGEEVSLSNMFDQLYDLEGNI
jgi:hypothetical protein